MPMPTTEELKFSDLQTEFGGVHPISFSEYYDEGSDVTNPTLPKTGQLRMKKFRGGQNAAQINITALRTNLVLSTEFGSDWTTTRPKILNISSGVTVGGTSPNPAIEVSSGLAGILIINNSGTIIGHGGTPGGHGGTSANVVGQNRPGGAGNNGGNGISVVSAGDGVTINNTGTISGGGGSGGGGGAGQRGRYRFMRSWRTQRGGHGGAGGLGAGYNQAATGGSGPNSALSPTYAYGGHGGSGGAIATDGYDGSDGNASATASYRIAGDSPGPGGAKGLAGKAIGNAGATWTNGITSGTYNGAYT